MVSRFNPSISVGGDARQAMAFSQRVFGGTLALPTLGLGAQDSPDANMIMQGRAQT